MKLGVRTPLLLAVLATAKAALAYRTASDAPEFAGSGKVRWADDTIEYHLHARVPDGIAAYEVDRMLADAFSRWSEPACSAVRFASGGATLAPALPGDGENVIQWLTDDWTARGFASDAAAVTDLLYERTADDAWQIIEADLYVNAETFLWTLIGQPPEGYRDVRSVVTHEAGHMLGLLHACETDGHDGAPRCGSDAEFSDVTMFPFYDASQAELAQDDIDGACFLYPRETCDTAGCAEGSRCVDGYCRPLCGDEVCGDDEVCTSSGCQPYDDSLDSERLGDPCSLASDCPGGLCGAAGYCTIACGGGAGCPSGATCVAGECQPEADVLGAECVDSTGCLGGECLEEPGAEPMCTRRCNGGVAACPADWFCDAVDGVSVCRPERELMASGGGGCSVTPAPSHSGRFWIIAVAAWATVRTLRLRRPRRFVREKVS